MKKIIIALISIFVFGLAQCITLAQDQDIYFIAYVNRLENSVKSNWVIPHGKLDKKTIMVFDVDKNGKISNISASTLSGDKEFDETVLNAISASNPLEPFPKTIKNEKIKIQFTFSQNNIEASPLTEPTALQQAQQNTYETGTAITAEPPPSATKKIKEKNLKIKKIDEKITKIYSNRCPNSYNAGIRPKTVAAATVSLVIWPGLGQLMNGEPEEKVETHAVLGIINVFRLWSFYDALVDRKGGVWDDRL